MLFIHAADIHLDSPLRNLALTEAGQLERIRRATRDAFHELVEYCIRNKAAFLILAGDLYDGDQNNVQTGQYLRTQMVRLQKEGIRVVIKRGNHDAQNRITGALDLPDNVTIFGSKKPESITYDDLGTVIHGQSFPPGPVTANLAASYPPPVKGKLNIGVLHTSLAGNPNHDIYAPCSLSDLTSKGYDYWALGHIHKAAVLSKDPWVVYPGNLQGRRAKEFGPKGCFAVTTEGDRIKDALPVPLDIVRWQRLEIDLAGISGNDDIEQALRNHLRQAHKAADGRTSAIRVQLVGQTDLPIDPRRWRQVALEIAGEISEDLWIEQLRDETRPISASRPAADNGALNEIIAAAAAEVEPILAAAQSDLAALKMKLPDSLKRADALVELDDPGKRALSVAKAASALSARLAGA